MSFDEMFAAGANNDWDKWLEMSTDDIVLLPPDEPAKSGKEAARNRHMASDIWNLDEPAKADLNTSIFTEASEKKGKS